MPQLHFQAACGAAAQVAQRPNKTHRREQQQQHANRLMRRDQKFQATVEMPCQCAGKHKRIAGSHAPMQKADERGVTLRGVGFHGFLCVW